MWRAIWIFTVIAVVAGAIAWFADRPGEITIVWLGYEIETSVMVAVGAIALAMAVLLALWGLARRIVGAPGSITGFFRHRRREKGYAALSQGMIALGAGDSAAARRHAALAERFIADEPLTLLLKAQTAQARGDETTAGRVFRAMLQSRETEALGLRGLFIQARREKDAVAARALAERAMALKPDLPWAAKAVLSLQSLDGDWHGAEQSLDTARRNGLIGKVEAARQRAVLLTAQALEVEDDDPEAALVKASEAHKLAPGLVPAAVIAGRILAAKGETRRAARILEKTWKRAPHPEVAEVYAGARTGDSPRDRFRRVRMLVQRRPDKVEGPVAIARAAIDAQDWSAARAALAPLIADRPQSRVCMLMAEIEDGEHGDRGRARQWVSRAVRAPRDPMWTADGYASPTWVPVSPATGALGTFEWKVPVEGLAFHGDGEVIVEEDEPGAEDLGEALPDLPAIPVLDLPTTPMAPAEPVPAAAAPEAAAPMEPEQPGGKAEPAAPVPPAPQRGADRPRETRAAPVVFVAPPAPDDPGPDAERDLEEVPARFRTPVAE
jgi:HemY protein